MATIREIKNKDGSISYKITVLLASVNTDGTKKQIRRSTTFKPTSKADSKIKKEVNAAAVKFEEAVKSENYLESHKKILFPELVKKWDDEMLSINSKTKKITPYTREKYLRMLELYTYPTLQYIEISKIQPSHISHIISDMVHQNKSSKTIRNAFGSLHLVLDYAEGLNLIPYNPCDNKNVKKILPGCKTYDEIQKEMQDHTFSEEEAGRFLSEALNVDIPRSDEWKKLEDKAYFYLAMVGGFRKGEILALTWNDILFDSSMVRISKAIGYGNENKEYLKDPKTSKGYRTIALFPVCFSVLEEWYKKSKEICMKAGTTWQGYRGKDFNKNYVFIRPTGERMPLHEPYKHFKLILKAYNDSVDDALKLPDIRLHDLRHTNISVMLAEGVDLETVSRRSGHAKTSFTTSVYGHPLKEKDKDAAVALEKAFFKSSIL